MYRTVIDWKTSVACGAAAYGTKCCVLCIWICRPMYIHICILHVYCGNLLKLRFQYTHSCFVKIYVLLSKATATAVLKVTRILKIMY